MRLICRLVVEEVNMQVCDFWRTNLFLSWLSRSCSRSFCAWVAPALPSEVRNYFVSVNSYDMVCRAFSDLSCARPVALCSSKSLRCFWSTLFFSFSNRLWLLPSAHYKFFFCHRSAATSSSFLGLSPPSLSEGPLSLISTILFHLIEPAWFLLAFSDICFEADWPRFRKFLLITLLFWYCISALFLLRS